MWRMTNQNHIELNCAIKTTLFSKQYERSLLVGRDCDLVVIKAYKKGETARHNKSSNN